MAHLAGAYCVERVQSFIAKRIEFPYVRSFAKRNMLSF